MEIVTVKADKERIVYIDPNTLHPHPMSAKLYLEPDGITQVQREITEFEAANNIMQCMNVDDIKESIRAQGILEPLVITANGIIISGSRRWKVAMQVGMAMVPVIVRQYESESNEKEAILDYNKYRDKNLSQKMREADLIKELEAEKALKRMLTGKKDHDPTLILAEGATKRHEKETAAIVGSHIGLGKDTYRKVDFIWGQAKKGNPKAVALVEKLDKGDVRINTAFNALKQDKDPTDVPSRWENNEPVGDGVVCTCAQCNKRYRLVHLRDGRDKLIKIGV